jgi:hypothetical protein
MLAIVRGNQSERATMYVAGNGGNKGMGGELQRFPAELHCVVQGWIAQIVLARLLFL